MKIGFIGAGRVGFSLGKYLKENNANLVGYYSANQIDSIAAKEFTDTECYMSIKDLIDDCDTLFLTVNDDNISLVVDELIKLNIKNKTLIHTSGAKSSLIFGELNDNNNCFSLHPIYAFNDKYNSYLGLKDISFTIEGNNDYKDIKNLFKNNKIIEIKKENKIKYHIACVFLSNFMNAISYIGLDILKNIGISDIEIFKPLILDNIKKIIELEPDKALTGPIKRCDYNTIYDHLNNIDDNYKNIYIELSKILINISNNNLDYKYIINLLVVNYETNS